MQIECENIHKHYGDIRANDGVSLTIAAGSIHGVLGENGAGKSTLMKILTGFATKNSGIIRIDGRPVNIDSPSQAAQHKIGMLHQEPMDFPQLSVLDNFMIGRATGFVSDKAKHRREMLKWSASLGFQIDPGAWVNRLTVGERQQLEILRLLALNIEVLILDEPTTGISRTQKEILFAGLKAMVKEGKSVVLVSHKLEDVIALCDTVTVMRQGKVSGTMDAIFDTDRLLTMMFGALPSPPVHQNTQVGNPQLVLENVTAKGGRAGLNKCSATIHAGEMVGLAGLEGSGQGVFLRVAAGLTQPLEGRVRFGTDWLNGNGYYTFKKKGGAFVPASRIEEGLVPGLTISDHYCLNSQSKGFLSDFQSAREKATHGISKFNIKGNPGTAVDALSGGNQQRLLLSLLPSKPTVLLLENPTRGLDVGSAHWVWRYLQNLAAAGTAIVFSTAELDEIMMVADRSIVFYNGSMVADLVTANTDAETLGRAVAGGALHS